MFRAFVLLSCFAACAVPSRGERVVVPRGAKSVSPAPQELASAPPFVELRAGAGALCGRTEAGALWCWGVLNLPGKRSFEVHAQPIRLEGLPPLAGFTLIDRTVIGWDDQGQLSTIAYDHATGTFAVGQTIQIDDALPRHGGRLPLAGTSPRIAGGSDTCLVTIDHQLLCHASWQGLPKGPPRFHRVDLPAVAVADDWCAIDAEGRAHVVNPYADGAAPVGTRTQPLAAHTTAVVDELGEVSSIACWHQPASKNGFSFEACGLGKDGAVRCTREDMARTLRALAEGAGVTRVFHSGYQSVCVSRDDGKVRCTPTPRAYAARAPLLTALAQVDAQRGLVDVHDAMCALGGDGVVRCWGETGSASLGDGSSEMLSAPVHLAAYDGSTRISESGGITCVQMGELEVRCFGRLGIARVDPAPLALPEAIDDMVGGFPLCVRGAASKRWYCRDPFSSFFAGTLASGFEPLRDQRGRVIRGPIGSVVVSSGTGIEALGEQGALYTFRFSGTRKPLRFERTIVDEGIARLAAWGADLLDDGTLRFHDREGMLHGKAGPPDVAGPVRSVASRCWIDGSGVLSCFREDETFRLAENTRALTQEAVLTDSGTVLALELSTGEAPRTRPIAGLPTMAAIAGSCGLSRERQVWCWGQEQQTDGPAFRLEARPIRLDR